MAHDSKAGFSRLQQVLSSALIVVLALPFAAGQTPAQQQPQNDKEKPGAYKFRVESELVLVNVVARDKQGKPITDLKQDDFTVLEDGKPQKIASFDFENLDMQPLTAAAAAN